MKKIIPRISTRGYYDLTTGYAIKTNRYHVYPKSAFEKLVGKNELTIMIHGLRNNNAGAINKTQIAQRVLRQLGYKYPVIGFSYDSNTSGAHLKKYAKRAINTGIIIAKKNGKHLAAFIVDFKRKSPQTKLRLIGHSLGSQVILSTIEYLAKNKKHNNILESVYFFGASIAQDIPSSRKYKTLLNNIVQKKIVNYFAPTDEVLSWANKYEMVVGPLGLNGVTGKPMSKYAQKKVKPKNHRFASYAKTITLYP